MIKVMVGAIVRVMVRVIVRVAKVYRNVEKNKACDVATNLFLLFRYMQINSAAIKPTEDLFRFDDNLVRQELGLKVRTTVAVRVRIIVSLRFRVII